MRRKIIPADFELLLCPSCGGCIDFTYGLRPCADCKRKVCVNCAARERSMAAKSKCNKCARRARIV